MVSGSTVISDTFIEIFNILNSNVSSITDSTGSTIELRKNAGDNYWTGAYPDIEVTNKSNYPIGVVNTPEFEDSRESLAMNVSELSTEIVVFGTRAEHPPKFVEKAWHQLKSNEDDLRDAGLSGMETGAGTSNQSIHPDLHVHEYRLPIELEFRC